MTDKTMGRDEAVRVLLEMRGDVNPEGSDHYGHMMADALDLAIAALRDGEASKVLPGVVREMREWLLHAEREDGTQTIAHADVAVRDWERQLAGAMLTDAGILPPAKQPEAQAVAWVDPDELAAVKKYGGMIVATDTSEPESRRTMPLYTHPTTPPVEPSSEGVTDEMVERVMRGKYRNLPIPDALAGGGDEETEIIRAILEAALATNRREPSSEGGAGPVTLKHAFRPHEDYPWFCDECGYPEHEPLKHKAALAINAQEKK